jgi:hypothetical protein
MRRAVVSGSPLGPRSRQDDGSRSARRVAYLKREHGGGERDHCCGAEPPAGPGQVSYGAARARSDDEPCRRGDESERQPPHLADVRVVARLGSIASVGPSGARRATTATIATQSLSVSASTTSRAPPSTSPIRIGTSLPRPSGQRRTSGEMITLTQAQARKSTAIPSACAPKRCSWPSSISAPRTIPGAMAEGRALGRARRAVRVLDVDGVVARQLRQRRVVVRTGQEVVPGLLTCAPSPRRRRLHTGPAGTSWTAR